MTVVLITGATSGIGRAAAAALVEQGAEVAIVGRDPGKVAATPAAHRYVADLERLDEVRRLAAEVLERHPRLDVLANNAGAMFSNRYTTADGLERTFALNHAAPFLLTQLLRDRLQGGRVVTTASDAHEQGELDLEDLQWERRPFKAMKVYGTTKLCNVLFTRELARREPGITATCFHPGVVRTGFGKNDGGIWKLLTTAAGPFFRTPEKGARSLVWLATDGGAPSGAYVQDEKAIEPSKAARDDELAAALYDRTAALVS